MGIEAFWHVGWIVLLLALVWGTWQYRRRSRTADTVGEAVTRQNYQAEDERSKRNASG